MSEENVEIARGFLDAAQRQDWKRAAELVDPDVEGHGTVGGLEEGQVYHGLPELIREYEKVDLEAWDERRLEPQEFLHVDDLVVVLLHEYRRGRGSGVELEDDTAVVFTVRDGRVVRIQGYMDRDAALSAAGLSD
jgi:ketosteroid isomerase-like protein